MSPRPYIFGTFQLGVFPCCGGDAADQAHNSKKNQLHGNLPIIYHVFYAFIINYKIMSSIQKHPFHLVDPSPWPLVSAVSCLVTAIGAAMFMHSFQYGNNILVLGLLMIISSMTVWWRDVIREATFNGHHTKTVQIGLRFGMILFILSEVMFFFAFFWAFFHASLSPAVEIGSVWPPTSINPFNPWGVPLLNTLILLLSGATVTWAHHEIIVGRKEPAKIALFLTIILAITFTAFQVYEYIEATFTISDGVYGSTFFMATGFHG